MKKIVLLFAAVAALASCVKENTLEQTQPADGLVTIKAIAMDTKTTLDGTDVLWEPDDAIKVVFNGQGKRYESEFTTSIDETSATADFSGSLDPEITVAACGETGYAVYPSSVTFDDEGRVKFFLDTEQNGTVKSGKNLSFAEVSLANLRNTATEETTFQNALSLVKVTVPEGVVSVTLNSPNGMLAGAGMFSFEKAEGDGNEENEENEKGREIKYSVNGLQGNHSVTLKGDGNKGLESGKVYYVQVFPGIHNDLKITVQGDDVTYERTLATFEFKSSEYHPLNIADIFDLGTSAEHTVSPFGDELEIPVITTLDNYTVTIPDDAKSWISQPVAVKGFHKDMATLTIAENKDGEDREAVVTFSDGNERSYDVTISQKAYVSALLEMELMETYQKNNADQTGTLSVAKTDNPSEGVYKITICGSTFYADYDSETHVLTVHGTNDVTFAVADDFTSITPILDSDTDSFFLGSTISDYSAIMPLGEPTLTDEEKALLGTYNESWNYPISTEPITSPEGMTISISDEALYGRLYVTCLTYNGSRFYGYADYDSATKKVTLKAGKQQHMTFNIQMLKDVVLEFTVNDDGTLSFDSWADGNPTSKNVTDYVATKIKEEGDGDDTSTGVADAASLHGTYSEVFNDFSGDHTGTMTISVNGENISVRMLAYNTGTDYYLQCPAILSSDGKTLTVQSAGVMYEGAFMQFTENIILNISVDGDNITLSTNKLFALQYGMLNSYTATKIN